MGKGDYTGYFNEQVTTVGNWDSILLGPLGDGRKQTQVVPPAPRARRLGCFTSPVSCIAGGLLPKAHLPRRAELGGQVSAETAGSGSQALRDSVPEDCGWGIDHQSTVLSYSSHL